MTSQARDAIIDLTVLIPCFNESSVLEKTVKSVTRYLDEALDGMSWELLFVDDGSTDNTKQILQAAAEDKRVRFISYARNRGQGYALQRGFEAAQGTWIFCVDADLDYGADHIKRFIDLASSTGAEIVVGSAYMAGGSATGVPTLRLLMSRAMNWYFSMILPIGFSTYTSILRLYKRTAILRLLLSSNDKDLLPEILIKANLLGIPMIETPAHLRWKAVDLSGGRHGASVAGTARKAIKHLLWGAMENPFLFFVVPSLLVGMLTMWFGFALAGLFFRFYSSAHAAGLAGITEAASTAVKTNPQTAAIFAILVQAALTLYCAGTIVLQNKTKKDSDFIHATRLHESIRNLKSQD